MVGLSVSHPHVGDIAGFEWLVCLSVSHPHVGDIAGFQCLVCVSHPHVGDIAGFQWLVCLSHTHMLGILLGLNGWSVCLTPTCWGYCWV